MADQSATGAADAQLPVGEQIFLDHVGYFVRDLDAAGSKLERLGFQVSQSNVQTNADAQGNLHPSGTSNRLVRLRRGYLEVLAATHDTPLARQLETALARYAGLHLVALSGADIAAQERRLQAVGFDMQPLVTLRRRDVTLPDVPELSWSVLRPAPGAMPEGRIQFVTVHNPEHIWRDELVRHRNGADALTDVLLCVEDRAEAVARFARYVDRTPRADGIFSVVPLDRGNLVFVGAEDVRKILPGFAPPALPFIAGQALQTSDLAVTLAALGTAGIRPAFADEDAICLKPADALGGYLLFHRRGIEHPWLALAPRLSR